MTGVQTCALPILLVDSDINVVAVDVNRNLVALTRGLALMFLLLTVERLRLESQGQEHSLNRQTLTLIHLGRA